MLEIKRIALKRLQNSQRDVVTSLKRANRSITPDWTGRLKKTIRVSNTKGGYDVVYGDPRPVAFGGTRLPDGSDYVVGANEGRFSFLRRTTPNFLSRAFNLSKSIIKRYL
jgi:IS5 family transposase